VVLVTVSRQDLPVYLEGIGSVVPIAAVTVKTQVDGRLEKVLFKEGQSVHRGELLAQIDPRPFAIQLHLAQAAHQKDSAQLRNSRLNLDRYTTLSKQNLIPQQQVDDQQTLTDQAAASVSSDQAQIESARLLLDYARLVSPIDGVTGVRMVDPGNVVHASDPTGIVLITQMDPIAVVFSLPEDDLARVLKQMAVGTIAVDAFSRDAGGKLASG
jgi:membrane fusion protein, multidrug efflux system